MCVPTDHLKNIKSQHTKIIQVGSDACVFMCLYIDIYLPICMYK